MGYNNKFHRFSLVYNPTHDNLCGHRLIGPKAGEYSTPMTNNIGPILPRKKSMSTILIDDGFDISNYVET